MKRFSRLLALASVIAVASAQTVPEFGQCGGEEYTGPTVCAAGSICVFSNPFYSQCLAGTSIVAPTSASSVTGSATSTAAASPTAIPSGFVKTSGTHFTLNGKTFTVVGANSYWVGLMEYDTTDMNKAFADIAATGATVVRTWGFNEVTTSTGFGAYYQIWDGAVPTVNTGANGLENFDNVVALAKANGLRLIVTLTNNWDDYGGMDIYVQQLLGQGQAGQPHDWFYSNATVIAAYKNYVKTFVTRYLNEPGILGWELANEPRCLGSTSATSGLCTVSTISTWVEEISAFIKSIDSNHLVGIGDEGFINDPGNPIFVYNGASPSLGIDFAANLNISSIDFGTFHLYPDSWGEPANPFGQQWITDHATFMKSSNKPAILEEFGITSNMSDVYASWYSTVLSTGLTGDLIWQAGSDLSNGPTANDGFAVYPGTAIYTLDTEHAAAIKARDGT